MSEAVLDRSKVEIKWGTYGTASYTSLADQNLISLTREFKRSLSGRMYPLDREGISRKIGNSEYHVSRKIDGEFALLFQFDEEVFSLNPGGLVRVGLPFMAEAGGLLKKAGCRASVIAGEFHIRKPDGSRSRVYDIVSTARGPRSDEDLKRMAFAAFDVVSVEDQLLAEKPFAEAWDWIQQNLSGDLIRPVEAKNTSTAREIRQIYDAWVESERAEGVVVRSESAGFFKIKPRHTVDVVVIGFTESTGD